MKITLHLTGNPSTFTHFLPMTLTYDRCLFGPKITTTVSQGHMCTKLGAQRPTCRENQAS